MEIDAVINAIPRIAQISVVVSALLNKIPIALFIMPETPVLMLLGDREETNPLIINDVGEKSIKIIPV